MSAMASQITSLAIVYSTVYLGADKTKHQSSAPLPFVREIHRWPVNYPHKGPVTRKMSPFDDVTMHLGRVVPYGDKAVSRYWLRYWFVAWRHQVITWTNDITTSAQAMIPCNEFENYALNLLPHISGDIGFIMNMYTDIICCVLLWLGTVRYYPYVLGLLF